MQINVIITNSITHQSQSFAVMFSKWDGSQTELLTEIEQDFLTQLDKKLKTMIDSNPNTVLFVLTHLYEQRELFCLLVRSIPSREFADHLFSIPSIRLIFQHMITESGCSETQSKYIQQFVFQGTFSVLYDWLNSENPEPVAEIAEVLGLLKSKL